jgi:hypothetical protein
VRPFGVVPLYQSKNCRRAGFQAVWVEECAGVEVEEFLLGLRLNRSACAFILGP